MGIIVFGSLFKKSWKAEKVMELNKMDPWEDFPFCAHGNIIENIFTAQKLPEWEVKKSGLVVDTTILIFDFILWILLIILMRFQGPDLHWWSHFGPIIEIFAIYVLYPIFLFILILIYYKDIKIYKSKKLQL